MSATERRHLTAILLAGVGLRVAAALYFGNEIGAAMPGLADQLSYHTLATRVMDGHGFTFATGWWPATPAGEPTAHWSYLYTLLVGGLYMVAGPQPLAVRLVQAVVVGALQPYLTWRISRRMFGPRIAIACALVAAVYGYFVYYGAALMTEALYLVVILWVIDIALRLGDTRLQRASHSWAPWLWLGLAMAATVLLRQVFLLCLPAVLLWIAARHVAAGRTLGLPTAAVLRPVATGSALSILVLVLCVSPATVRNYQAFGRFVPINTNAGFALFWGNHPVHGDTFKPLLPGDGSSYGKLIPDELRHLNEAELDQALLARGLQFVTAEPGRYLRLTWGRFCEYFKFWPSPESSLASNVVRVGSSGVFLPLAALGLALAGAGRQAGGGDSEGDRGSALLLPIVATAYTLIHLLVWALVRYRLPVDALLMPFAGVAIIWLFDRFCAGWLAPSLDVSSAIRRTTPRSALDRPSH